MDEDDYLNFGNAYPAQSSTPTPEGQASWNPALRPNTHRRNESRVSNVDDDFFERYPGPTPEKPRREAKQDEQDMGDGSEDDEHNHASMLSTHDDPEVSPLSKRPDDFDVPLSAAVTSIEQQTEAAEGQPSKPSPSTAVDDVEPASEELHDRHDVSLDEPAVHYEHQSEVTALEEAIDESVKAPLIADEQPEPTIATVSREPTFAQSDEPQPVRSLDRSFTTNFTEIPQAVAVAPDTVETSSEWPSMGDDKTFADLLDTANAGNSSQDLAVEAITSTGGEQDLAAAWAAALADDDILEEPNELDPTSFFGGDDDDGFLDDESEIIPAQTTTHKVSSLYVPSTAQQQSRQIPFGAPLSPFIDQSHSRSAGTPSTGLHDLYAQDHPAQPTRPQLPSAQSFVDRGKNGYQSPYDLPMDVVKTRRRPQASPQVSQNAMPMPPPRTSSFGGPLPGPPLQGAQIANFSPPTSSHGSTGAGSPSSRPTGAAAVKPLPKSTPSFFEELPVTSKARARTSGMYMPQQTGMPIHPLAPPQQQVPVRQTSPVQTAPSRSVSSYTPMSQPLHQPAMVAELRQPDRAPLFPDQGMHSTSSSSVSAPALPSQSTNRYSPAPPAGALGASNASRYSPAPAGQATKSNQRYSSPPSAAPVLPPTRASQSFAPRTSSPLAVHGRPQPQGEVSAEQVRSMSAFLPGSPGKVPDFAMSPERRASGTARYAPSNASSAADNSIADVMAPRRQRTQSPTDFRKIPVTTQPMQYSAMSPPAASQAASGQSQMRLPHKRQFSRDLPFAMPHDDRSQDPLERWKGHPIFHWNAAGTMVYSLPRQTPFYAAGSGPPSVKCTSGDVMISDANSVLPMLERDLKFPGPLTARSKGKKKDLLAWVTGKVHDLQATVEHSRLNFELSEKERHSLEEKLVLWQIVHVYLDNDGVLEGSPKLEEQVRQILLPDLAQKGQVVDLQSPVSNISSGDVVDKSILYQIRQALFEGQRERAVWLAEEKRLWGHAMLIASTMGPETFRQIISSFVRSQVKSQGSSDLKSLAALYQVFAASPEDCVDELVPPSARAGFQMISTTDGRGTADSLTGIDQWRETLSLVHSNPTQGNSASVLAIGKLLASYGRIEAAHICYIFARSLAKHAGADDPEAHFVLLGSDAASGSTDLDSLMLTEIYEYATSLSAPATAVQYIPHLQAYKLLHARYLASSGYKAQAQSYCEHIDAAIRSTTRPSGYYHQAFAQELMSFNALLSQSPQTDKTGGKFFSRPAMDKVSSGMGSWFTKFVSGDEAESDSNAANGVNEAETFGPFGGVASGPVSRTASTTELYNPAITGSAPVSQSFQPSSLPSRYTPLSQNSSNKYAPAGVPQFSASRSSFESDRSQGPLAPSSMPSAEPLRPASSRYAPVSGGQSPALLGVQSPAIARRASDQSLASTGSYEPKPLLAVQDGYGYTPQTYEASGESQPEEGPEPAASELTNGTPHHEEDDASAVAEDAGGYMPPTMGYEPPTFQPYEPEPDTEQEKTVKAKKKSFMDDDDDDADMVKRAAAFKAPATTREPDPAVAAAAAADAARDAKGHSSKESASGWFGGWFGKKDPNAPSGPIKAKLGEESSFYFDKELNKWVNKKAGADAAAQSAPTPPPPKMPAGAGPPSRVSSGGAPPMSGPPSRQSTPAIGSTPPSLAPKPGPSSNAMPPPARPASSMSTASSLDDLLGGPSGGKKAGGAKPKKKGRYVDVMANAS